MFRRPYVSLLDLKEFYGLRRLFGASDSRVRILRRRHELFERADSNLVGAHLETFGQFQLVRRFLRLTSRLRFGLPIRNIPGGIQTNFIPMELVNSLGGSFGSCASIEYGLASDAASTRQTRRFIDNPHLCHDLYKGPCLLGRCKIRIDFAESFATVADGVQQGEVEIRNCAISGSLVTRKLQESPRRP